MQCLLILDGGVFWHLDKTTVFQEARVFNESNINPRKCRILLTKIMYLLYLGEQLGTQEATELFFGVTKLFQHKDPALRQMVYLVVKELSTIAQDVIMVTSIIMKDTQHQGEGIYRPNAIRTLCRIIDPSMIQGIERYLKSAMNDKNPTVSSAALVSSYHLSYIARDVVKRWANEAQEAINAKASSSSTATLSSSALAAQYMSSFGGQGGSGPAAFTPIPSSSNITQYHALGLLYLIRQHDRMAVTKMIQQLAGASARGGSANVLRSPTAHVLLIRYAAKILEEDPNSRKQMLELLEGWLRHKSDMVNLEAARAICDIKGVTQREVYPAISVLQLFLSSPKTTLKFAAIRTLNKLALILPSAVQQCNLDMENMITDSNRSIATFAITTLLKTGNEASVDRLMKQITGFMGEISDEFKIIVVEAIRSLCLKFPAKQAAMLSFLSNVLRDEGGYEFKRAVVEAMFDMIKFIPDSKEAALAHLCEFIEDCEFAKLSVRILHLLGVEGPKTAQPTKYIRYIYNRVILEVSLVRASAVSALAKFGVNVPDLAVKQSIRVLLTRCLDDVDDEVRDRAAMYLRILDDEPAQEKFIKDESTFSLATLESQLAAYVSNPAAAATAFDITSVPKISKEAADAESLRVKTLETQTSTLASAPTKSNLAPKASAPVTDNASQYAQHLSEVPELAPFGALLKSSVTPVELTESETEYVVTCVKHIYKEHVVFQFNCTNTLNDTVLEDVSVILTAEDEVALEEDFIIPAQRLTYGEPGVIYVSFKRLDKSYAVGAFTATLKFVSKEIDPDTNEPEEEGYEDEYQIEDISLTSGDYISPAYMAFNQTWEELPSEQIETFALTTIGSIKEAVTSLIDLLSMHPLEGTEEPTSTAVHTLLLAGRAVPLSGAQGPKVLARVRMSFQHGEGVTIELATRSENEEACTLVISAIA